MEHRSNYQIVTTIETRSNCNAMPTNANNERDPSKECGTRQFQASKLTCNNNRESKTHVKQPTTKHTVKRKVMEHSFMLVDKNSGSFLTRLDDKFDLSGSQTSKSDFKESGQQFSDCNANYNTKKSLDHGRHNGNEFPSKKSPHFYNDIEEDDSSKTGLPVVYFGSQRDIVDLYEGTSQKSPNTRPRSSSFVSQIDQNMPEVVHHSSKPQESDLDKTPEELFPFLEDDDSGESLTDFADELVDFITNPDAGNSASWSETPFNERPLLSDDDFHQDRSVLVTDLDALLMQQNVHEHSQCEQNEHTFMNENENEQINKENMENDYDETEINFDDDDDDTNGEVNRQRKCENTKKINENILSKFKSDENDENEEKGLLEIDSIELDLTLCLTEKSSNMEQLPLEEEIVAEESPRDKIDINDLFLRDCDNDDEIIPTTVNKNSESFPNRLVAENVTNAQNANVKTNDLKDVWNFLGANAEQTAAGLTEVEQGSDKKLNNSNDKTSLEKSDKFNSLFDSNASSTHAVNNSKCDDDRSDACGHRDIYTKGEQGEVSSTVEQDCGGGYIYIESVLPSCKVDGGCDGDGVVVVDDGVDDVGVVSGGVGITVGDGGRDGSCGDVGVGGGGDDVGGDSSDKKGVVVGYGGGGDDVGGRGKKSVVVGGDDGVLGRSDGSGDSVVVDGVVGVDCVTNDDIGVDGIFVVGSSDRSIGCAVSDGGDDVDVGVGSDGVVVGSSGGSIDRGDGVVGVGGTVGDDSDVVGDYVSTAECDYDINNSNGEKTYDDSSRSVGVDPGIPENIDTKRGSDYFDHSNGDGDGSIDGVAVVPTTICSDDIIEDDDSGSSDVIVFPEIIVHALEIPGTNAKVQDLDDAKSQTMNARNGQEMNEVGIKEKGSAKVQKIEDDKAEDLSTTAVHELNAAGDQQINVTKFTEMSGVNPQNVNDVKVQEKAAVNKKTNGEQQKKSKAQTSNVKILKGNKPVSKSSPKDVAQVYNRSGNVFDSENTETDQKCNLNVLKDKQQNNNNRSKSSSAEVRNQQYHCSEESDLTIVGHKNQSQFPNAKGQPLRNRSNSKVTYVVPENKQEHISQSNHTVVPSEKRHSTNKQGGENQTTDDILGDKTSNTKKSTQENNFDRASNSAPSKSRTSSSSDIIIIVNNADDDDDDDKVETAKSDTRVKIAKLKTTSTARSKPSKVTRISSSKANSEQAPSSDKSTKRGRKSRGSDSEHLRNLKSTKLTEKSLKKHSRHLRNADHRQSSEEPPGEAPESPRSSESELSLDERILNINRSIDWVRKVIMEMRAQDFMLKLQFDGLRQEIRTLKQEFEQFGVNCECYDDEELKKLEKIQHKTNGLKSHVNTHTAIKEDSGYHSDASSVSDTKDDGKTKVTSVTTAKFLYEPIPSFPKVQTLNSSKCVFEIVL